MTHLARIVSATAFLAAAALLPTDSGPARAAGKSDPDNAWPEVTQSEKALTRVEQDPEADVVILDNARTGKIVKRADDWVNVMSYHWKAKVLTEAGKRDEVTQVHIPGGKYSRVSEIHARTIKPDGTIIVLPDNQVFEKTVTLGSAKFSEWVFSFPAVDKGAILEYKYDRYDNYLAYIRPFDFEGPGFTLHASVSQAMPEEAGYQILCSRCPPGAQPSIRKWFDGPAKGKMYTIDLNQLPGYRQELLMPPRGEISPRLEMVLNTWKNWYFEALKRQDRVFVDWNSVAMYAEFYYEKAMADGQQALQAAVGKWLEGVTDRQEKIKSIARHVRDDFQYIPYTNIGGWSRPVGKLMEDMSADNEEKAVLMRAALRIAGIESQFALAIGRDVGVLNPEFYGLSQFTHAVVAVPKSASAYDWIDPTVPYAPDGFLPWKDSGAKVLLIKSGQGEIVDIPVKNETARKRYDITVRPQPGGMSQLIIRSEYTGEDAIEMRGELAPAAEEARRRFLDEGLRERLPGAQMTSFQIEHLADADEPLVVLMEATAPNLMTQADEVTLVRACLLSSFASNPIHRLDRHHPLCVDRGWNVQEETVVEAPAGLVPASLPEAVSADSGVARMSFKCGTTLEGNVRCLRVFSAPRKRWPPNQMENFSRMLDKLVQADRTMVAFQKKPAEGN